MLKERKSMDEMDSFNFFLRGIWVSLSHLRNMDTDLFLRSSAMPAPGCTSWVLFDENQNKLNLISIFQKHAKETEDQWTSMN